MKTTLHHTIALGLLLAAGSYQSLAQCQSDKITATDAANSDLFGGAVGISGDFAVIGARDDDSPGLADAGAAYIFTHSGFNWTQVAKLTASDRDTNDHFGTTVAIDGDYAVVGSPNDDYAGFLDLGSVYVFHRVGGVWTQEFHILVPVANRPNADRFGTAIAISGSTIAVGTLYDTSSLGTVYVFTRSGANWSFQQRIQPAALGSGAFFGDSVALDGNTLVVGATDDDSIRGNATGAAYIFARSGGLWTQQSKVVGSSVTSSSQFGRVSAMSGDRCVVAAPFEGASGAVYVFRNNGGPWVQEQRIASPEPATTFFEGYSLGMTSAGTRMIVGRDASGAAVGGTVDVYTRTGTTWTRLTSLRPSDPSNSFDFAVSSAIDGDIVIVGDEENDFSGLANPGAAYLFEPFTNGADLCASAIPIVAGTYTGCTSGKAANGASTCGTSNASEDVYYSYTASCTGRLRVNTIGSNYDTVLSVHSNCPATTANQIACDDDIAVGNLDSDLTIDVVDGETYVIRVAGFNGADGAFVLTLSASAMLNNSCRVAQSVSEGMYPFGTCLAGTDGDPFVGACTITDVNNDVWYRYTSSCSGAVTIDTCNAATNFDTALAVYEANDCPTGSIGLIACNDDGCTFLRSRLQFDTIAGTTYMVRVGGYSDIDRGSGVLTIDVAVRCPADYNSDGGIDGTDVPAFYSDWEGGLPPADVNCDGGIDGADVDYFFEKWSAGGCF